jgi:hypothetical protein
VDDQLSVRAYNGPASRWYQSAMAQHAGRITAAVVMGAEDLNAVIDAAYRQKYTGDPYLSHMIGSTARAATVRISPHSD